MSWGRKSREMMPTAATQEGPARVPSPSGSGDLVRLAYNLTADLAKPNAAIYWTDLLLSASVGYGAFAVWFVAGMSYLGLAAAIVSVLALYRCIYFIHELTHLRKRAPRGFWTAWHVLIGVPQLLPSFFYDGVHNFHHSKAHYGTAGDPEYLLLGRGRPLHIALMVLIAPFEPLFLVTRFLFMTPIAALIPAARPYVIERLSAIVMNTAFRRTELPPFRTAWLVIEVVTTIYAWSVVILVLLGIIPLQAVLMWLAIWACMSTIDTLRTLAAHHYENDGEPIDVMAQLLDTVNVPPPAVLPMLWAPVGMRYHGLHHLLPNLPYHSLGCAHRRLLAKLPADNPYLRTINRGFLDVLARMLRSQEQVRRAAESTPPAEKVVATTR